MLIPKKDRVAVYMYLFKEGVLCAKKDLLTKHHAINVPNLYVLKLMQSLKSRKYVTENFNWQWYYFYLTNEGIEYLRGFLHLPEEIIPTTLKKARQAPRYERPERSERPDRPDRGFRRPYGGDDKKTGPGADFRPGYRGMGMGRGRAEGAARGPRPGPTES